MTENIKDLTIDQFLHSLTVVQFDAALYGRHPDHDRLANELIEEMGKHFSDEEFNSLKPDDILPENVAVSFYKFEEVATDYATRERRKRGW
ncbi:hypothetical protein ACFL96_18530 [Thermoproteota archaeon]